MELWSKSWLSAPKCQTSTKHAFTLSYALMRHRSAMHARLSPKAPVVACQVLTLAALIGLPRSDFEHVGRPDSARPLGWTGSESWLIQSRQRLGLCNEGDVDSLSLGTRAGR